MVKLIPLIDKKQIASKIASIAEEIDRAYADKDLVIIMVLKGSICLAADLIRTLQCPNDIEVVQCKSYGKGGAQRGALTIHGLDLLECEGRDLLVVDDIFDSGATLTALVDALQKKKPRSIKSLVLLSKQVPRVSTLRPDYALFEIENRFVVGYGLDYKERYRGLPGVFILEES